MKYNVSCEFFVDALYQFWTHSYFSLFFINVCWILSNVFSSSVDMIMWFILFFRLLPLWLYWLISYNEYEMPYPSHPFSSSSISRKMSVTIWLLGAGRSVSSPLALHWQLTEGPLMTAGQGWEFQLPTDLHWNLPGWEGWLNLVTPLILQGGDCLH